MLEQPIRPSARPSARSAQTTDQTGEREHKTDPVHTSAYQHASITTCHTAKPQNSNDLPARPAPTISPPTTQPPVPVDRIGEHTPKSEPVHAGTGRHRSIDLCDTTKPLNSNNPHAQDNQPPHGHPPNHPDHGPKQKTNTENRSSPHKRRPTRIHHHLPHRKPLESQLPTSTPDISHRRICRTTV